MWIKLFFILLFVSLFASGFLFAQKISIKADTTKCYENIESYSEKTKFTKFMYRLILKPVAVSPPRKKTRKTMAQKPYSEFEGKTIRHINLVTLDPFNNSIADTIVKAQNLLSKAGNKLHVTSQNKTIRNLMLIHQNQPFDSLLVKESERLVRSRGYVSDVSFFVKATSKNSDSVDVFIRVLDNWSIIPKVDYSTSRFTINLTDENFLGLGHEYRNAFTRHKITGDYAYNINYFIPNIRNTYISTTLHYGVDEFRNFTKSFSVERPFFSAYTRWIAGINFTQQFRKNYFLLNDTLLMAQNSNYYIQDYWAGKAIQIFKCSIGCDRSTNFISAFRYLRIRYLEKPLEIFDAQHSFSNEDFYLAGVSISMRKYVQDKYIFNFGLTEDVPVGWIYGLTSGYQIKNNAGRFYLGARISSGNYYPWGYLSSNIEYGTFFNTLRAEQGVFAIGINYFTNIFEIGKWKFREFAKSQATIGINRFSQDSLTLNDGYGLDGFNSTTLSGNSRILFTLQTQSYAPWNFIGFRFGPYLICSIGTLGYATNGFINSHIYSQIGVGMLIKNVNLVINTFQFSITFYPLIPGNGQNIFKVNSSQTTDFGFRDFEIGKPATVLFQ